MTTISCVLLFYLTSGHQSGDGCVTKSTEYLLLGRKKSDSDVTRAFLKSREVFLFCFVLVKTDADTSAQRETWRHTDELYRNSQYSRWCSLCTSDRDISIKQRLHHNLLKTPCTCKYLKLNLHMKAAEISAWCQQQQWQEGRGSQTNKCI